MTDLGIYTIDTFNPRHDIGRLFGRVRKRLLDGISARLKVVDLTAAEWVVLVYLADSGPTTSADLCKLIQYNSGAIARLIDRLEKKNILRRLQRPEDRRASLLELTERGMNLYPEIVPAIVDVHNALLNGMTAAEAHTLHAYLERIVASCSAD